MRIMIADDSAVVRTIISQGFTKNKDIDIIASVSNCQKLLNNITVQNPDVIICGNEISEGVEKEALNTITNKYNIPALILENQNNSISFIIFSYSLIILSKLLLSFGL